MPLILAFDTATDRATSALVGDGEVLGERVSRASTLLADVDALVRQAGAHPRDITGLALGIGPGSFTGIRVGVAAAHGLAIGWDAELRGMSSLALLAAGAGSSGQVAAAVIVKLAMCGESRWCSGRSGPSRRAAVPHPDRQAT